MILFYVVFFNWTSNLFCLILDGGWILNVFLWNIRISKDSVLVWIYEFVEVIIVRIKQFEKQCKFKIILKIYKSAVWQKIMNHLKELR